MSSKQYPDSEKTPIFLAPRRRKELFERGMELFNLEEFFEAHEVWEELWHFEKGQDKTFVQGLICLAGHYVALKKQNWSGAEGLVTKAKEKLKIPPNDLLYRAVDIEPLLFAIHYNSGLLKESEALSWDRFVIPKLSSESV